MKDYLQEFLIYQNNLTNLTTKKMLPEHQQIEQLASKKLSSNELDNNLTTLTTKNITTSEELSVKLSSSCQTNNLTTKNSVSSTNSINSQVLNSSCQVVKSLLNIEKILAGDKLLINGKEVVVYKAHSDCIEKGGCFRFRLNCPLFPIVSKEGKLTFLCHSRF